MTGHTTGMQALYKWNWLALYHYPSHTAVACVTTKEATWPGCCMAADSIAAGPKDSLCQTVQGQGTCCCTATTLIGTLTAADRASSQLHCSWLWQGRALSRVLLHLLSLVQGLHTAVLQHCSPLWLRHTWTPSYSRPLPCCNAYSLRWRGTGVL